MDIIQVGDIVKVRTSEKRYSKGLVIDICDNDGVYLPFTVQLLRNGEIVDASLEDIKKI